MIPLTRWPAISLTVGVAAVALVAFAFCRAKPTPIPTREQHTIDSLAITKPGYQARRDTFVRVESIYVAQSAGNARQARQARHAADSLHALANAAQRVAEAERDTSSRWHDVAVLRGIENDSLRVANTGLDSALAQQIRARTAADARSSADSARLYSSEDLNRRLAIDLQRASPPCRIAWAFKCPTRTQTAVVSLGLGVLAKVEYDRLKNRRKS